MMFNIIDLVLIQRIYPEGWYRFTPNIKIDLVRLPSITSFEIFFSGTHTGGVAKWPKMYEKEMVTCMNMLRMLFPLGHFAILG